MKLLSVSVKAYKTGEGITSVDVRRTKNNYVVVVVVAARVKH